MNDLFGLQIFGLPDNVFIFQTIPSNSLSYAEYLVSAGFNFRLSYAIGCKTCPKSCSKIAPTDIRLASLVTTKGNPNQGFAAQEL